MKRRESGLFRSVAALSTVLALKSLPAQEGFQHQGQDSVDFTQSLDWRWQPEESLSLPLPASPVLPSRTLVQRPLMFERNEGQTAKEVVFLSRGRGYTLFLNGHEAVMKLLEPSGEGQAHAERAPRSDDWQDEHSWNSALRDEIRVREHAEPRVLRMRLAGARLDIPVSGEEIQRAKVHYFIGSDASRWRTNISTYGRVKCEGVYPGIDLVYYGNEGKLEYDFVVAPGADPNQIAMEFDGADGLRVDEHGELVLDLGGREVRWQKPLIYQEAHGRRVEIAGRYRLRTAVTEPVDVAAVTHQTSPAWAVPSEQFVSFELAGYDQALPLVIDPILIYSSYLGGGGNDAANGVELDEAGNVYVAGSTASIDFPTKSALNSHNAGGDRDVFVAKFTPAGELLFSTYLGGSGDDDWGGSGRMAFAVSGSGECYVAGTTTSWDFPLLDAVQGGFGGGLNDAFVTGLAADGSALLFSTYLGGDDFEAAWAVALGQAGDIYVGGHTLSAGFPSLNGFQPQISASYNGQQLQEGFITRLGSGGKSMVYSTFYGQSDKYERVHAIAVDADGSACVALNVTPWNGSTGWLISRISPDGASRLFERQWPATSTATELYLGIPSLALSQDIAVVVAGNVFALGKFSLPAINKPNASTSQGYSDAIIARFSATNGAFISAAYIGGSGNDGVDGVMVDREGNIVVAGSTVGMELQPSGFPVMNPMESGPDPGKSGDVFVAKFRPSDLQLTFSTLFGGPEGESAADMALDARGNLWITGGVGVAQLPTLNAFQAQTGGANDAFLAHLSLRDARVQITRSDEELTLSWPAEAEDYVLEATTSLPAVSWTTVTNTPIVTATNRSVQLPLTGPALFFRLRQP